MYIIAIEIYQFCLNFILGFIFLKLYLFSFCVKLLSVIDILYIKSL